MILDVAASEYTRQYNSIMAANTTLNVISIAFAILELVAMWKLFEKAGKPGWAAIIPIYNIIVMLEIAGMEWWYIFLFLIPVVNFIVAILIVLRFVKAYGKGTGFGILAIFFSPIMYAIMAFGNSQYQGN